MAPTGDVTRSTHTDMPARFFRDLMQQHPKARWQIRMISGHEYRAQVAEISQAGMVAGLNLAGRLNPEYIRLDQIEAITEE
jgi:hypothetical protein